VFVSIDRSKAKERADGMSERQRMTGGEGREEPRPERQRLRWIREYPLLVGVGVLTVALVGVAMGLAVFEGEGQGATELLTVVSPTPQASGTVEAEDSGPPPVDAEPTFTDSGLGIIDIEPGTGETPVAGQTLVVDYTLWLTEDGTKVDSSVDRGEPIEFVLGTGQMIAGWEEGLSTMKVGGKRRLIMPPELAYGEEGRPPAIPPNANLTFDVELLEIKETS
jgi:hypothetical protein